MAEIAGLGAGLQQRQVASVVIDSEAGPLHLGLAGQIAAALGARYLRLATWTGRGWRGGAGGPRMIAGQPERTATDPARERATGPWSCSGMAAATRPARRSFWPSRQACAPPCPACRSRPASGVPAPWRRRFADAFARGVAGGARRVLALPVLLHFGEHGTRDMPREACAAAEPLPAVEIRLAQPLTGHPPSWTCWMIELRGHAVRRRERHDGAARGRGSTIARANADLYARARLFQERGPFAGVEVAS